MWGATLAIQAFNPRQYAVPLALFVEACSKFQREISKFLGILILGSSCFIKGENARRLSLHRIGDPGNFFGVTSGPLICRSVPDSRYSTVCEYLVPLC